MFTHRHNTAMSGGREFWSLLLLLLLVVVVPTACLLWFMTEAANNERMAVRQKLADVYGRELQAIQDGLGQAWQTRVAWLAEDGDELPALRFQQLVTSNVAESVLIFDTNNHILYPSQPTSPESTAESAEALRTQIQSLLRTGDLDCALDVAVGPLSVLEIEGAKDRSGRQIVSYVFWAVMQSVTNNTDQRFIALMEMLISRTEHYGEDSMPSAQRLFLMQELERAYGIKFTTQRAEELAATCIERAAGKPGSSSLTAALSNELWWIASPSGRTVGLYTRDGIARVGATVIGEQSSLTGVRVELVPSDAAYKAFLATPAGSFLPGWTLMLSLEGEDPFTAAAEKRVAAYFWTAVLIVAVIAIFAALMGRHLVRQICLNRLKNDFVATVSHELKTPLASMRVLVDTLIDGRQADAGQAAEYLQLISKENERLSRLIDNFLTFSRMERNKRAFNFVEMNPDTVARAAVGAVRERFEAAGAKVDIASSPDLSAVLADKDALVTVLINLLDNAFKYSENDKKIVLRAYASGGGICFEVEDNGIGMSRRDTKRIWDRFYQVDQSLARRAGGCGLGLSIVKFIVEAHGGRVDVKSVLGQGSTFSVIIPMAAQSEQ